MKPTSHPKPFQSQLHSAKEAEKYFDIALKSSDYYTKEVALRDAVTRPSKRISSWELLDGAEKDRALKTELDRQRAKAQKVQQERTYER